jgi:hypothetical protein
VAADLYERTKAAVIATLVSLDLAEVGARVDSQWQPDEANAGYPRCAVLPPPGEAEGIGDGTTEAKDYVYPFLLVFVDRAGAREHDREPVVTGWREQTLDAFGPDRIDDFNVRVPEAWNLELVPRAVVERPPRSYQLATSPILLKVTVRKAKG